jgi:hypothetical protein
VKLEARWKNPKQGVKNWTEWGSCLRDDPETVLVLLLLSLEPSDDLWPEEKAVRVTIHRKDGTKAQYREVK